MRNTGASIYAKLKSEAKLRRVDTGIMIRCWVMEGFLRRLSLMPFHNHYALKGSHLHNVWNQAWATYPRDVDLECLQAPESTTASMIVEATLVNSRVSGDGVWFDTSRMATTRILGPGVTGMRVTVQSAIASANHSLQVDISEGHPLLGRPVPNFYPSLLPGVSAIPVLCSPVATAMAEQLAYLVEFGDRATRVQDLFGLWRLAGSLSIHSAPLLAAVELTFSHRWAAQAVARCRQGLTLAAIADDPKIQRAWQHWKSRNGQPVTPSLEAVLATVGNFANPLLVAFVERAPFDADWHPGLGWRPMHPGGPIRN